MLITIAQRLRPFSHEPGARCLIPCTSYIVEAYPAVIIIKHFAGDVIKKFPINMRGPLKQFTVMQDLEKGCVTVFSEQYTLHILPNLDIVSTKNPHLPPLVYQERLSLGSHKKLDVDRIRRNRDYHALFPLWFRLGGLLKLERFVGENRGMFSLLADCIAARDSHRPEILIPCIEKLFLAGFTPFLIPRAQDEQMQGILPRSSPLSAVSPLYLLTEGAALIRSLFFLDKDHEISILPYLPPECFAGRMTGILSVNGITHLEWSKKTIRQLHFLAKKDGEVLFHFPPQMVNCRLRISSEKKHRLFKCGEPLEIKSGSLYLLDRFQK